LAANGEWVKSRGEQPEIFHFSHAEALFDHLKESPYSLEVLLISAH